ncbi:hypothetical protein ACU686_41300 [Yinghuangia aomiensis]
MKIAHPDIVRNEGFRRRFTNEVRAMGTVVGDGVPRLLDADSEAEKPWLATEFLRALRPCRTWWGRWPAAAGGRVADRRAGVRGHRSACTNSASTTATSNPPTC